MAVEVVLSAVDCGVLEPFKDVIGVGGSCTVPYFESLLLVL
ncbi:MAG: hypothetical protein ACUVQ5_05220 [Candidatus Methanomethylicaceae archaeon]